MRYGVVILPEHPWERAQQTWRLAEEFGFDHAWTYDHLVWRWLRDKPWYGTVPTLTAAATATSRISLGTLVASPGLRHPVLFAKELITLDDISRGRVVCGVGAGGYDADVLVGRVTSRAERADRFDEFVEILDRLLTRSATTYEGRHYAVQDMLMHPGCVQQPRIPFAVAACGPRGMRLAARHAETWVTSGTPGDFEPRPYRDVVPLIAEQSKRLDESCAEVGRDPSTLRRLLLTGAMIGGVLDSVEAFRDATGVFAEAGVTDLVVHWPRESFPYRGRLDVLERIAGAVLDPTPPGPLPNSYRGTPEERGSSC